MVGMHRMSVVAAQHEGPSQGAQIVLLAFSERRVDARQRVVQEGGKRPLLGARPHLLGVKERTDRHVMRVAALKESLEGGKVALQVIQLG